jgi:hypothetical protein
MLFGENGAVKVQIVRLGPGDRARFHLVIESLPLSAGRYFLTVAAHSPFTQEIYDWHEAAYPFEISVAEDMTRSGPIGLSTRWSVQTDGLHQPSCSAKRRDDVRAGVL